MAARYHDLSKLKPLPRVSEAVAAAIYARSRGFFLPERRRD